MSIRHLCIFLLAFECRVAISRSIMFSATDRFVGLIKKRAPTSTYITQDGFQYLERTKHTPDVYDVVKNMSINV